MYASHMNFRNIASERNSDTNYLPPWARYEHQMRYQFAKQYVSGKDVVDCACGSGESSSIFASAGAKSVIGIDLDELAISDARSKYVAKNLGFLKNDGIDIPVPDQSCDVVVSLETIEHVLNDVHFVKEIHRVLRSGGILICSTPNREITNPRTLITDKPWNQFHVREYSFDEFENLFDRMFFSVLNGGQNPSLKMRRILINYFAKIFGTKLAIRSLQIWKCRWFIFRKSRLHKVQTGDMNSFEFFVLVLEKSS